MRHYWPTARYRRPLLGIVAAFIAVALAASGCSSNDNEDKERILIGVNIELSGGSTVQGTAYSRALKIIRDDINQTGVLGGRKIELLIQDNKSSGDESAQVARDLIDNKNVVAIVGPGATPTTLPVLELVEERKIPTISMGSSSAIVTPVEKHQYMFKTPANTDVVVANMVSDLARQGLSKVAVLTVDSPYGDAGLAAIKAAAETGRISVAKSAKFSADATDVSAQVESLTAAKPDAILVWAVSPAASNAAKSIRAAKFEGVVYFDAGAGAELFLSQAGEAAEGMFMVHPGILAVNKLAATARSVLDQKDFYAKYSQKYGAFSGFASYAADALGMIVAAIEKAGNTDRADIRDALENLSYDGLTGTFEFSKRSHGGVAADALAVLTVRRREWRPAQ